MVEEAEPSQTTNRDASGNILSINQKCKENMLTPLPLNQTKITENLHKNGKKSKKAITNQKELKIVNSFVPKQDVLQPLFSSPSGLTCGQLLPGGVETPQKELCRDMKDQKTNKEVGAPFTSILRRLRLVKAVLHGTRVQAFLDFGAISNLLSTKLVQHLGTETKRSSKKTTLGNGGVTDTMRAVSHLKVSFEDVYVLLYF